MTPPARPGQCDIDTVQEKPAAGRPGQLSWKWRPGPRALRPRPLTLTEPHPDHMDSVAYEMTLLVEAVGDTPTPAARTS